jgi:cell wall-associated NlpC family hydrolase
MPDRPEFVKTVRSLIGIPWVHAGRTRAGVDCVGLILLALDELGIHVEVRPYGRWVREHELRARLEQAAKEETQREALPGDLLLLSVSHRIQHIGVLVLPDWIVHSHQSVGKVVLERLDGEWGRNVRGVFRIPALEGD